MQHLSGRRLIYARLIFVMALAVVTCLLLWTNPPRVTTFDLFDKVEHACTFVVLTLLGLLVYTPRVVLSGLIAYGGVMEVMQQLFTTTRIASLADWLADIIGIMVAWGLYRYWLKNDA